MANKELTAKVKLNITDAERKLTRLSKLISGIDKSLNKRVGKNGLDTQISKARIQQEKLNQAIAKTKVAELKVTEQKHKTALAALKVRDNTEKARASANGLLNTVKKIAGAYLGIQTLKLGVETSDRLTQSKNMLNNMGGGSEELTASAMDKVYGAAQRSRSNYTDMLSNVGKTMILAGDSFQNNVDNAVRFQEIMAKAYTVGGASATEASTSMYQLTQALGAGVLAGDELRSVREGAPLAYKEIEKFAQENLKTTESLKDLASQGVITSDIVVAAIMSAGDKIDKKFENTQMTFKQAWDQIKNTAVKAFEPALTALNEMLNSDAGKQMIEGIGNALVVLGGILTWVINGFSNFFNWCADNWEWLKYIIVGALVVIGALLIKTAALAIWSALQTAWAWIKAHWALLLIVAAVMAILYVYEMWRQGAISTTEAIVSCLLIIAAVALIAGIVLMSIPLLVVAIVIAAIALIVMWLDYFLGVVYSIGAAIYNIFVGQIDAIIQLVWTAFVEPFIGIIEWILNVCNGGFDSFGGAVANLIGQVISWFLSLGKVVTKIIDAIFGTNWTDGLNSLQDKVLSWGKNENSITLSREAPTVSSITGGALPERIAYTDAWNTGMEHGQAGKDWLNDWGSQFQNQDASYGGLGTDLTSMLGLNGSLPDISADGVNGVAGAYDPTGANEDIAKGIEKLGGDVGDIKDTMDLENDELEYLRKVAEMEWRNEFTTAEIKVDMTNHNTVNGEQDLDGIVAYLSDVLREEMAIVADGVHY